MAQTYDRWAAGYDRRWRRYTDRTHAFLLEHLTLARTGDVLDVGCGTGTLLLQLGRQAPNAQLFGVDASAGMLAQARRSLVGQRVELRSGNACRLPFPNAAMDLVIMASVLHYLRRPSCACAEACRVLRPGGTLAIVDYLPRGAHGSVVDGLIRHYDRGHVRSRPRAELCAILAHAGFEAVASADFPIGGIFRGVFANGVVPPS